MRPRQETLDAIQSIGDALAEALGGAVRCIAVYGSAASDDFSPTHSDVNLVVVLSDVTFNDLRLIGDTLQRVVPRDLEVATPLVVAESFLHDARDSFPMELTDIAARHVVLAGEDLLSGIDVPAQRLREEAEREARSKLLRMRSLVMHRPADEEVHRAIAHAVSSFTVIWRALHQLGEMDRSDLLARVGERQGRRLVALPEVEKMREGATAWPAGADLDDLLRGLLGEMEALVEYIDRHGLDD